MPDIKARKQFGQHFIHERLVLEQIIHVIHAKPTDTFLEIGPGKGALTELLLAYTHTLDAVEIDRDLCALLETRFGKALNLHCGDILEFDINQTKSKEPLRIIGNLPYNISTPLIFHLFESIDHIRDMHFMLQLEVAQRLTAQPGDKAYSKLSVISAGMAHTQILFEVAAEAFSPPPQVTSAFVKITPAVRIPDIAQRKLFNTVVRTAFTHRRKTLAKNLHGLINPAELSQLGINPGARPETIAIESFLSMVKYLNHGR